MYLLRPTGGKALPPRPPPAKTGPGRPPPPKKEASQPPAAVPSAAKGQERRSSKMSKKGPSLPPRPRPGHQLYNKYTVSTLNCLLVTELVATEHGSACKNCTVRLLHHRKGFYSVFLCCCPLKYSCHIVSLFVRLLFSLRSLMLLLSLTAMELIQENSASRYCT